MIIKRHHGRFFRRWSGAGAFARPVGGIVPAVLRPCKRGLPILKDVVALWDTVWLPPSRFQHAEKVSSLENGEESAVFRPAGPFPVDKTPEIENKAPYRQLAEDCPGGMFLGCKEAQGNRQRRGECFSCLSVRQMAAGARTARRSLSPYCRPRRPDEAYPYLRRL